MKGNPWIAIADLFSSVVLIVLFLFVMAVVGPKFSTEVQRAEIMTNIDKELESYEKSGQLRVLVDKSVMELTSLTFKQGSAQLNPETLTLIHDIAEHVKKMMTDQPKMEILIEGHTDPAVVRAATYSGGFFENNIQLSTLRASNVRAALLKETGEDFSSRIGVAGYGETRLRNTVDVYAPENRRIEIRLLWDGK